VFLAFNIHVNAAVVLFFVAVACRLGVTQILAWKFAVGWVKRSQIIGLPH
jgi:hypothetical protein